VFGTSAANTIKAYIKSNPNDMFTNESDIAKFVELYMEVQQTPPTVPFLSLESLGSKGQWETYEKSMPVVVNVHSHEY
jgi:hypothetical protein